MRKAALNVYSKEIEEMYVSLITCKNFELNLPKKKLCESGIHSQRRQRHPSSWSLKDVESFQSSSSGKKPVSATADLFDQGPDSLGATILRHRVVGALQASESPNAARLVSPSTIYEHSTVAKLASFVVGAIVNPERLVSTNNRADEIERMIKKYSFVERLPLALSTVVDKTEVVVLITGTTGNLGAQLVDVFLRDGRVKKVYTLNRPSGGGKKDIRTRHSERGL